MKFSAARAFELENHGIGLVSGASYVLASINDVLLDDLKAVDFSMVHWQPHPKLVVVKGARGKLLIRFARVDESGRFLEFKPALKKPTFASVALLNAEVHDPVDFVVSNTNAPIRRIRKIRKKKSIAGIHIGDESASYSSLLSIDDGRLIATDIEPDPKGGDGIEATEFVPITESEVIQIRGQFRLVNRQFLFSANSPYTTNTQLAIA